MNEHVRLLVLGRDDATTRMVYHALASRFVVEGVITEDKIPAATVFRRRARRLGYLNVIGQALFMVLLVPYLRYRARRRVNEIKKTASLSDEQVPKQLHAHVSDINSSETQQLIRGSAATHILVNGTRLLSKETLAATEAPFMNIHLGWNPQYRGGNGGYWALAMGDRAHCGTTVHHIDTGIDTGAVLARVLIEPTREDNFTTYPLLQLAAGIDALKDVLVATPTQTDTTGEPSHLWHHPTIWGYLWRYCTKGIK